MALPADDLVDAVVPALQASPPTPPTDSTLTVVATDTPTVDPDKLAAGELQVWVFWENYEPGVPASRGEDTGGVTVGVVAVERYTDAGRVTLAWRRERSAWFKAAVVEKLNDPRVRVGGFYPDAAEAVAFDRDQLTGKVWWEAFTVTMRKDE